MTNIGWYEVDEDTDTPWGDPRLRSYDYSFAGESGAVAGERLVNTSDGGPAHPFHYHSSTDVWIEVGDQTAEQLSLGPQYWRRLGLGRLRKDGTVPLEPPADRIWIQASQGDNAVVVIRPPEDGAPLVFFHIGALGHAAGVIAGWQLWVSVIFFVGDGFLPGPTARGLERAWIAKRAWGGHVACTSGG